MLVRGDPAVHDGPVEIREERVDVGATIGLEVEEVRMLVDVERDERRRVPDRVGVLGVADVVEEAVLVPVVRRPGPAAPRHPRRLEVVAPRVDRAEVALDQAVDRAGRVAACATEVREVDLVVLDPADREAEVDLQGAQLGVDLVRPRAVDRLELGEDLVPLDDVALIQPVVGLDGGT